MIFQAIFAKFYRSRCPHRSSSTCKTHPEISSKSFAHKFNSFLEIVYQKKINADKINGKRVSVNVH